MSTGVGFGDYQQFLRSRDGDAGALPLRRAPYSVPPERSGLPPPVIAARPVDPAPRFAAPQPAPQPIAAFAMAAPPPPAIGAPLAAPMMAAPAPLPTAPVLAEAPRQQVSNQQDFLAVLNRTDGQGSAAPRTGTIPTVDVMGIPDAAVQAGPNIMAYALAFDHPVGVERFRRMNPLRWRQWENACLQHRTQEDAQRAFLAAGGPERDSGNLDPDGDGYACWWDPAPYRRAMQATQTARR